ncbi:hypothetical protein BD413DRAFT_76923 [Trametes elegans]|nr:hypothetical protein BD413DRAFT_76923 [Trametes elegans]
MVVVEGQRGRGGRDRDDGVKQTGGRRREQVRADHTGHRPSRRFGLLTNPNSRLVVILPALAAPVQAAFLPLFSAYCLLFLPGPVRLCRPTDGPSGRSRRRRSGGGRGTGEGATSSAVPDRLNVFQDGGCKWQLWTVRSFRTCTLYMCASSSILTCAPSPPLHSALNRLLLLPAPSSKCPFGRRTPRPRPDTHCRSSWQCTRHPRPVPSGPPALRRERFRPGRGRKKTTRDRYRACTQ